MLKTVLSFVYDFSKTKQIISISINTITEHNVNIKESPPQYLSQSFFDIQVKEKGICNNCCHNKNHKENRNQKFFIDVFIL